MQWIVERCIGVGGCPPVGKQDLGDFINDETGIAIDQEIEKGGGVDKWIGPVEKRRKLCCAVAGIVDDEDCLKGCRRIGAWVVAWRDCRLGGRSPDCPTDSERDDYDCEVVFVERLDVVRGGTPGWYAAYRAGWIVILALPVLYLVLMWIEAGRSDTTTLGRLE